MRVGTRDYQIYFYLSGEEKKKEGEDQAGNLHRHLDGDGDYEEGRKKKKKRY